jgi:hypothetical protein
MVGVVCSQTRMFRNSAPNVVKLRKINFDLMEYVQAKLKCVR